MVTSKIRSHHGALSGTFITGIFLWLLSFLLNPQAAHAADIGINIVVVAKEDIVEVKLKNTGKDPAINVTAELDFLGKKYSHFLTDSLAPSQEISSTFFVSFPDISGSFPLLTTASYTNDGTKISALDAGYFNFRSTNILDYPCPLTDIAVARSASIAVPLSNGVTSSLFAAPELGAQNGDIIGDSIFYTLLDTPSLRSNYATFSIHEGTTANGFHATRICPFRVSTRGLASSYLTISPFVYFFVAIIAFIIAFLTYTNSASSDARQPLSLNRIATIRWAFSIATVSFLLSFLFSAYHIPDIVLPWLPAENVAKNLFERTYYKGLNEFFNWGYFGGKDYLYFIRYVADPLYIYMLFGNWFVLRFVIKPNPQEEKYWHLMLFFFSLVPFRRARWSAARGGQKIFWTRGSKIALLALCVKIFYFPVFTSWTIGNFIHEYTMYTTFRWDFKFVSQAIINSLILLDVLVFTLAYSIELPQLKNQIKSVEPTLFGWFICLVCYPPFNQFSMMLFDIPLTAIGGTEPYNLIKWIAGDKFLLIEHIAQVIIVFLWGIYVWATVALAWKASNLTNRGIVSTGPYAYIRHPAYISKVLVWILTSLFLGTMYTSLVIALGAIYALRAWTEERHLGQDPQYLIYKDKVPWKIFPKVY